MDGNIGLKKMKTKLLTICLFLFTSQVFAESHKEVKPWPNEKLKDIEIELNRANKGFGIVRNEKGQFISIKTNEPLNGNHKIDDKIYPFKNGLLHGEAFGATYKNGQLNGVIRRYSKWYDDRSVSEEYLSAELNFINGLPNGVQNWYDPSGNIIETAFYQNGKRVSHKKIFQKTKTQNSDENDYENERAELTHKFLEICSKSKIKRIFDDRSHVYIFTGSDLDPNCLQKEYSLYRNNKYIITTYEDFPWGPREKSKNHRMYPTDEYDESIFFSKEDTYIRILSAVKELCTEGCRFQYDHIYFFGETFIYMTDFYGQDSYTSLSLNDSVINYGMSMYTHNRSYVYSIQDILNAGQNISSFYLYGDAQEEITKESYTSIWEKKYWQGGGALWISTKRNYKNEILELKSWGNVCDSLSNHIFWNLRSKNDFPNSLHYEYFKLEIMSYLTKQPAPKWWLAALVNYKDNQWCYENPKL
jgi:hypothetical protein